LCVLHKFAVFCMFQGIVIGTGENSEFGEVFKMMQAEEVSSMLVVCRVVIATFIHTVWKVQELRRSGKAIREFCCCLGK